MITDEKMSLGLLKRYKEFKENYGLNSHKVQEFSFPSINGSNILDLRNNIAIGISEDHIKERIGFLGLNFLDEFRIGSYKKESGIRYFEEEDVKKLGLALLPYVSFGVLNGGSATSYLDAKKNKEFGGESLFDFYEFPFLEVKKEYDGKPKGITPAYMDSDSEDGYSYLELKLRHILILQEEYERTFGKSCHIGFFQMTSPYTQDSLEGAYEEYENSPALNIKGKEDLLKSRKTGVQSLIWAFDSNTTDKFFNYTNKNGEQVKLSLPGGHGQNFYYLKDIYKALEEEGYRYAFLGNVDNLGYTINIRSLGLLALKGNSSGFEFSFKTPLDKKGGVLIQEDNKFTCLDIGGAISSSAIEEAEQTGSSILFNCATGLFNLNYLNQNIDYIIENIPTRFIKQDKDIGSYTQAEQITWEVISLLENPLIFCVNKEDRFLSAKFILEMFLTCSYLIDQEGFPFDKVEISSLLERGFKKNMQESYKMSQNKGVWRPI